VAILGPVVLTVATGVNANASIGSSAHPEWLELDIAAGGLTLNGGTPFNGSVVAPTGSVTLNATLNGSLAADRLTINAGGALKATE